MSTLIKISNHLALILPGMSSFAGNHTELTRLDTAPGDTTDQIQRNRELAAEAFPNETPPKYGPAMLNPRYCGKWLVLETLLKEWHKDPSNKVLIFTKSVKLLDMLDFHLSAQSECCDKLPSLGRDRKSTRLNSSHSGESRMPSSA